VKVAQDVKSWVDLRSNRSPEGTAEALPHSHVRIQFRRRMEEILSRDGKIQPSLRDSARFLGYFQPSARGGLL
jgi:hypothetical protein